jgi:thiopeptide-type bacteriocin biosynthesis protein
MAEREQLDGYVPSGFFALRTPLLPFDELLAWSAGLQSAAAADDATRLEAAMADDRARLRGYLRTVYARPEVRDALFVASPDLDERFDIWLRAPDSEPGQKMERAFVRYFARMAGRATPFGLFAGCSVGTIGGETSLVLAERARYRRHTRLDMDYLVLLTDALARVPDLQPVLTFGVNSSLYPAGGRLRYFEVRRDGKGWTHHQVALEASDYLEATLARARAGAKVEALAAVLLEHDPEASREEAEEYIGGLIDSQVLVSELRPTVTGDEPIHGLATRLRERPGPAAENPCEPAALAAGWKDSAANAGGSRVVPPSGDGDGLETRPTICDRLGQVHRELASLDATGLGDEPQRYRHVAELLKELPGEVQLGRLFQVDMVKPVVTARLGHAVLNEIRRGVALLHRLARPRRNDPLARFREAFVTRYEGREVPLVEALDEDTGVGFDTLAGGATDASSLLDGLTFPKLAEETVPWGKRETHLLGKLSEALASGAGEIQLAPRDVEAMAEPKPLPLPNAFAVMASVAAASDAALTAGDFQVLLEGVTGPSGARLLGRFCHADPELHRFVTQHVRAEEALEPDAVFAEIVHLPEGRIGNILARPILRDYEIPYLGTASVGAERQIPVTDLRVSVVKGQIVLRSARLGRRVMPRLTSAHNFHASQGIYRFLCALQSQGTAGDLGWDWGPLRDAPFLPRVVCGRLVLARATWRVSQDEFKTLGQARGASRFRAARTWRATRRLPRWIALADADNELPVDMDNVLAVDTLVELCKEREQTTIVELFPGSDHLWVQGPEGRFVHELVVPFVRDEETRREGDRESASRFPASLSHRLPASLSARSFPPGSEWLYVKLYTGPATVDRILRAVVQPVVESVLGSGAADRWFFIRYGDPDWHLRLRFHGQPDRLHDEVMPALQAAAAPLLDDGRLWRVQFDTYEREVERYGGPDGIELAERLFHADSTAVLALADAFAADARGDVRWRLALFGMDLLLNDLGFDLATRREVIRKARDEFAAEFHADASFKHQLSTKFRPERKGLETLLDPAIAASDGLAPGLAILRRRSEWLAPVMAELKSRAPLTLPSPPGEGGEGRVRGQAGRLSVPLTELAPSYLHMHANRILRSAHRAQELVLYDFLARLYESQAAQSKKRQ